MSGMNDGDRINSINIRPGVTVLSVLRHLNYRPWFALAEFVDNSIQSFVGVQEELDRVCGHRSVLRVDIEVDRVGDGCIVVRDNAGGIRTEDYGRAFRPAELPPDRKGLAEFGMGMKSAACWFSPSWRVRTSALGESVMRQVDFDVDRIVRDELEELDVVEESAKTSDHFTEITLLSLHNVVAGRTVAKIKDHLCEIYRVFTRKGLLILRLNGEELRYSEPEVLVAPRYDENHDPMGESIRWRVDFDDFDFGSGLRVGGFAALRRVASTKYAGFSLFRRDRLVEGSSDEKYRPQAVFGRPNDFAYQRLFGELHLEGFGVSHTKDGFRWDDNEEPFLELLKERLSDGSIPLLRQARNYRVRPGKQALRKAAETSSERTALSLRRHGGKAVACAAADPIDATTPSALSAANLAAKRIVDLNFEDRHWRVVIELSDDPAIGEWLEISESVVVGTEGSGRELLGLRLSLRNEFMERFVGADSAKMEPLLRVVTALGLAEKVSRDAGVRKAGVIRHKLNKVLKLGLSRN